MLPPRFVLMAGATTVTSPSRISSLHKALSPGAKTPSSLVNRVYIAVVDISRVRGHYFAGWASPILTALASQRGRGHVVTACRLPVEWE